MIQFRMLNSSRGPAVMSPRTQIDRVGYQRRMKHVLELEENIDLLQQEVTDLIWAEGDRPRITAVQTRTGAIYDCRICILATGTFLDSKVIVGDAIYSSGPDYLFPAIGLSDALAELGHTIQRFKTGTPARLHRRSLKLEVCEISPRIRWPVLSRMTMRTIRTGVPKTNSPVI